MQTVCKYWLGIGISRYLVQCLTQTLTLSDQPQTLVTCKSRVCDSWGIRHCRSRMSCGPQRAEARTSRGPRLNQQITIVGFANEKQTILQCPLEAKVHLHLAPYSRSSRDVVRVAYPSSAQISMAIRLHRLRRSHGKAGSGNMESH